MATVNLSDYKPLHIDNAGDFRIGIVVSEWNDFVTHNLRNAAQEILEKEGVNPEKFKYFQFLELLNLFTLPNNCVIPIILML
jgi:Riboflavin synthase beta-chain